jgi:hypothetical protein
MTRAGSTIAVALAAALIAGCGSGGSGGTQSTSTTRSSAQQTSKAKPERPGAPKPRESIQEAAARIKKVASSSDCGTVNQLNPIGRGNLDTETRCKSLQRLATLKPGGQAAYGGGGVVQYQLPNSTLSVLLVLDSDGLFHVTYLDQWTPKPTIGTKFAKQFDAVAERAVDALRNKNCGAYYDVSFREFGPGALDKHAVCTHVNDAVLGEQLRADPKAKPVRMGGNGTFAFYGLDLPGAFWTLILAKETPSDVAPPGASKLPEGAPTYGYVDAFRTNPPPSQPSGSG